MGLGNIFGAPKAPEIPPPLTPESPADIVRRALRKDAAKVRVDQNFLTIKPLAGLGITTAGSPSTTTSGTYVPPSP